MSLTKNTLSHFIKSVLSVSVLSLTMAAATTAYADDSEVMIIQVSDLHGNMVPHAGIIEIR